LTSGWTRSCGCLRGRHRHSDATKDKLRARRLAVVAVQRMKEAA
jgi:hypothetical protein